MPHAEIIVGDALHALRTLPDASVHTCVTSPPYYGLRDYQHEGQIGLEPTPAEYVARLVDVFSEVWRVLRDDGTCWINLGDSYANDGKWGGYSGGKHANGLHGATGVGRQKVQTGLKPKDLIGVPWRVAFALQDAGWYLRSDVIWAKGNPMPESVTDRPTRAHEYVFLLTKRPRYFYDAEAVKEESAPEQVEHNARYAREYEAHTRRHEDRHNPTGQPGNVNNVGIHARPNLDGKRNRRSVWHVNTTPFPGAHFATFPVALVQPCIAAGTSERGCCPACGSPYVRLIERTPMEIRRSGRAALSGNRTDASGTMVAPPTSETVGWAPGCTCDAGAAVPCTVLDPFAGAGTALMVALGLGRNAVGVELNPAYADMAAERIRSDAPLLNTVTLTPTERAAA